MASPEAVRQALIQRVSRKVSGHGVTRRSIEGAVDRVLAALPLTIARAATLTGTAGRYTVATIRLAGEGTTDLQRLAGELGASVSVLDDADARQVTA